jgi:hypothetical protein
MWVVYLLGMLKLNGEGFDTPYGEELICKGKVALDLL